jgi:hypothetical protein
MSGEVPGESVSIDSNAVRLRTGRGLNEWLTTLDGWDGDRRKLTSLTDYLVEQHHLDFGWAQVIALYYLYKRL